MLNVHHAAKQPRLQRNPSNPTEDFDAVGDEFCSENFLQHAE
jgi:hypothetical protein